MHAQIPHRFSKQEAVPRVKKALEEARPQFSSHITLVEEVWEGNIHRFTFEIQAKKVEGTLEVAGTEFMLFMLALSGVALGCVAVGEWSSLCFRRFNPFE